MEYSKWGIIDKIKNEADYKDGYSQFRLWGKDDYNDDEDVVWAALKHKPSDIQYVSPRLRGNKEIMLYCIRKDWKLIRYAERELLSDYDIINAALEQSAEAIEYASSEFRSNDEVMFKVVHQKGSLLQYASNELKDNEMIVLEAIKTDPSAIHYANERFDKDKRLVLKAVAINGLTLRYIDSYYGLCEDKDVILTAIRQNPAVFQYVEGLDKEIVLEAVKRDGSMLEYADRWGEDEYVSDPEIVLVAVKQNVEAIKYAKTINKEIALFLVEKNGLKLNNVFNLIDELKEQFRKNIDNLEYELLGVKGGWGYHYSSTNSEKEAMIEEINGKIAKITAKIAELERLASDRDISLAAVKQHCRAIEYVRDEYRDDFEIVMTSLSSLSPNVTANKDNIKTVREAFLYAIKEDPKLFRYASTKMRTDKNFIRDAVRQNPTVLEYVETSYIDLDIVKTLVINDLSSLPLQSPGGLRKFLDDRKNVLELVKCNGLVLQYVNSRFKSDKEVVLEAVKQNGIAISFAVDNLKWDQEIVTEAVKNNAKTLQYTAYTIRKYKPFLLEVLVDNKYILPYIDADVRDYDFLLEAVSVNGMALELCEERYKKDKNLVLAAVKQNGLALAFAHSSLQKDKDVIKAAINNNPEALKYAKRELSPIVQPMNIVEQPEQVPTVDQELEEIQEIRGGRVGFFKRFFNRIKGNDGIRKVHLDEMKEIYDKIRILPEGDLKESLQLDYNDMLMHYSVYADTINNSNLSEVPDLEYTEKLQSISYRLKNHEAAMKATVEEQLEEPVMGTK